MHDDDEPGETTPTTHPLSAQRVTARELIWIRRELHQVALALHGLSLWMVLAIVLFAGLYIARWVFGR
jgi:hypothetical protein